MFFLSCDYDITLGFCSIFHIKLLSISTFALKRISPLYVATARYTFNMYRTSFHNYDVHVHYFIDCVVKKLIFKLHTSFLSSQNVPRNEIAAYHHAPSPTSTTHKQKRGKISTWTDGRVFVLGAVDFCRTSKITENNSILCEFVLNEDRRIKMLKVHDVDPISVYVPIVGDITARVNVPDVSAVQRRSGGRIKIPLQGPDATSENPFVIW